MAPGALFRMVCPIVRRESFFIHSQSNNYQICLGQHHPIVHFNGQLQWPTSYGSWLLEFYKLLCSMVVCHVLLFTDDPVISFETLK